MPARTNAGNRQLLISGMHRSGTSLVASALKQAGVAIGKELLGPGPGNPRGHFEDLDFWQLHQDMLAAAGLTALSAQAAVNPGLMTPTMASIFEDRARQLIAQRQGFALWGFKDPRTCLFLDFWQALLPEASFLLVYRHPFEVALSLRQRATEPEVRLDPWAGLRAWLAYNNLLLEFSERFPERCFLAQMPALGVDLPAALGRIASALALPLSAHDLPPVFAATELTSFRETEEEGRLLEELIPEALELYRRLEAKTDLPSWEALEDETPRDRETQRRIAALLGDLCVTRGAVDGSRAPENHLFELLRLELVTSRQKISELERLLEQTQAQMTEGAKQRQNLLATLTEITGSRAFAPVALWWRLARWLAQKR